MKKIKTTRANYIALHVAQTIFTENTYEKYNRDLHVKYSGEAIVYALQAVSFACSTVLLNLVSNYLYDKFKDKTDHIDKDESDTALNNYKDMLDKLDKSIISLSEESKPDYEKMYKEHLDLLYKLENTDEIKEIVENKLRSYINIMIKALVARVDPISVA